MEHPSESSKSENGGKGLVVSAILLVVIIVAIYVLFVVASPQNQSAQTSAEGTTEQPSGGSHSHSGGAPHSH